MMNNQNSPTHSPAQESVILKKKVDLEHQKLLANEERINDLKTKIDAIKQRNLQKRQILAETQQKVMQQKLKQPQQNNNSSSQSDSQHDHLDKAAKFLLNNATSLRSQSQSPILQQLRQHYKALRLQMMSELLSQEDEEQYQDEIDVDNMTYEQLLELGDKIGKVSKGLDLKKIDSLEVKKYQAQNEGQSIECAICREQLQERDESIELHCKHVFHDQCIKGWLNIEKHCPNCKRDIHVTGEGSSHKSALH